jgi:hypothetical protein
MSELYGKKQIVIEGENARKVYKAILTSHAYKTYPNDLKLEWREDVLFIEEEWWGYPSFSDFVLPFLVGDQYYFLSFLGESKTYETNDTEGKYFTIPQYLHT